MFLGPIHTQHGDETRPSVLPMLSRTPESVPTARGNGARIMNIFAEGEFIPMLRMYWPKETSPSIINGSWKPPAVVKVN